jgi:hypothetical protein
LIFKRKYSLRIKIRFKKKLNPRIFFNVIAPQLLNKVEQNIFGENNPQGRECSRDRVYEAAAE